MSDCRVAQDTNDHYGRIDELEYQREEKKNSELERIYSNPELMQESLSMEIMDFDGTRLEEGDYWRAVMLELADAHKHKDMQKIGMVLYPHMKAYIDYMAD